jgi:hypothetical protein
VGAVGRSVGLARLVRVSGLAAAVLPCLGAAALAGSFDGEWRGFYMPESISTCRGVVGAARPMTFAVANGQVAAKPEIDGGISWRGGAVGGDGALSLSGALVVEVIGHSMSLKGRFSKDSFIGYFDASHYTPSAGFLCLGDVVLARAESAADRQLHAVIQPMERAGNSVAAAAKSAVTAPAQTAAPATVARAEPVPSAPVAPPPMAVARAEPAAPPAAERSLAPSEPPDLKTQLTQLDGLRTAGLITDAEFEARKRALLDRSFGRVESVPAAPAQPVAAAAASSKIPAGIKFGNYHALVIGINKYQHLKSLTTAEADAKATAALLRGQYGFTVRELLNPTRTEIVDALDEMRGALKFEDNLLIYFAGHGWLDEATDQGYWLPADARPDRTSAWVSNATITEAVRGMEAKHVMVIADSCYSGRLVCGTDINLPVPEYLQKMSRKKARVVITSGGLEPVLDADPSGHSPFARAFLETLSENDAVLDGNALFNAIRRPVMVNATQTPQYSDIRNAGHDGGDFLFVRRR